MLRAKDPHETAYQVIGGTPLRKLKDRDGAAMTDQYLVQLAAKRFPTLQAIYQATSGFVHLSDRHFWLFFRRTQMGEDGQREFSIGEDEAYIPEASRSELLRAFILFTETVPKLVDGWTSIRERHGTNTQLLERFPRAA